MASIEEDRRVGLRKVFAESNFSIREKITGLEANQD